MARSNPRKKGASYLEDPDVKAMLRFKDGHEQEFRKLYEKHKRAIYSWVLRMIEDQSKAEDITQETFLRVYRAKYRYEPKARFRTWIFTIASRLALNEIRQRNRSVEKMSTGSNTEEDPIQNLADANTESALESIEVSQLKEMISMLLSKISERQRAALMLRYFEELSHQEISEVMGIRIPAVKSLLHRGLVSLEALARAEKRLGT